MVTSYKERIYAVENGHVTKSVLLLASAEEIEKAQIEFNNTGKCYHDIFSVNEGMLDNFRRCSICDQIIYDYL